MKVSCQSKSVAALRIFYGLLIGAITALGAAQAFADSGGDLGLGLPVLQIPEENTQSPEKIALGRKLFFDKRLSRDGNISCSSCHQPQKAFSDGREVARGIGGRHSTRNAPTIINAAFNTTLFWDGRRLSLESQSLDPFVNPREHGLLNYDALLNTLRGDGDYVIAFRKAFVVDPAAIQLQHIAKALAAFERTLIAGGSPFDRFYFAGQVDALSPAAQRGLSLFVGRARCATCHLVEKKQALFTDNEFHVVNIGVQRIRPHLAELTRKLVKARVEGMNLDHQVLSEEDLSELGRFAVTLEPIDIGRFRTPSLRNVALTAPYMHTGTVPTLLAAVQSELYQRGMDPGRPIILTPGEQADLVEFLRSLTSPIERLPAERISGCRSEIKC